MFQKLKICTNERKNVWTIAFWLKMWLILLHHWSQPNWPDLNNMHIQIMEFRDRALYFLTAGIYLSRHIRLCRLSNFFNVKISNEESRITYIFNTFMSKNWLDFFFLLSSFLKHSSKIYFPLYAVKGWVFWKKCSVEINWRA